MKLSRLAFGSMRLHERSLDDAAWLSLLRASLDAGVTTLHSSTEYESHDRFCGLLRQLGAGDRVQHIVKLAEPHFGDAAFDRARLVAKVDAYLQQLGTSTLDAVQWMWRGDLKDEAGRLRGFSAQIDEIVDAFAELKRAGKVAAVAPFPYTAAFADALISHGGFDGLAVYLNSLERDMVPQIERAADAGMGTIAIRPLAAGKALAAASPAQCLAEVLRQRGVNCAVVTYSSLAHLEDLVAAV
ncbi:MAG: aldo/keto reductase [Myxococcales bacterium]|nr:aldo/keto reductase [Myxococcales bacterium]